MRRLVRVIASALLAAVPAVQARQPVQFQPAPPPPLPPSPYEGYGQPYPSQPTLPYAAPSRFAAVAELLDEGVDPLLQQLNNDFTRLTGVAAREDRDVFAGVEAVRVTGSMRFRSTLPGWYFRVVETPRNPGEFRYLRFAWKKTGGTGIMLQLYTSDIPAWNTRFFSAKGWDQRFYAGKNAAELLPARQVSDKLPGEWEVVTRDLYTSFGSFTLNGLSLAPMDGTAGLFDHVLIGRTVEDLDRATDAALGREKAVPLVGKVRDLAWSDLTGPDAKKAAAALRAFLSGAPDHVGYIRERLDTPRDKDFSEAIPQLVRDLDDENFDTRERATDELIRIGQPAVEAVQAAGRAAANDEVKFRVRVILKKLGAAPTAGPPPANPAARLSRAVRVLERAGEPAKELLAEIAGGKLAPELAADAKAALARLPK